MDLGTHKGYPNPPPIYSAEAECVCGALMECTGSEIFCRFQLRDFISLHKEHQHEAMRECGPSPQCDICGCTEYDACIDHDGWPCSWAEFDPALPVAICTHCVEATDRGEEV